MTSEQQKYMITDGVAKKLNVLRRQVRGWDETNDGRTPRVAGRSTWKLRAGELWWTARKTEKERAQCGWLASGRSRYYTVLNRFKHATPWMLLIPVTKNHLKGISGKYGQNRWHNKEFCVSHSETQLYFTY